MTTNKNITITWVRCTNSGGGHVAVVTKFCSVAPSACGLEIEVACILFLGGGESVHPLGNLND
jgi:hypothetical protein